jgi:hypothetical protein
MESTQRANLQVSNTAGSEARMTVPKRRPSCLNNRTTGGPRQQRTPSGWVQRLTSPRVRPDVGPCERSDVLRGEGRVDPGRTRESDPRTDHPTHTRPHPKTTPTGPGQESCSSANAHPTCRHHRGTQNFQPCLVDLRFFTRPGRKVFCAVVMRRRPASRNAPGSAYQRSRSAVASTVLAPHGLDVHGSACRWVLSSAAGHDAVPCPSSLRRQQRHQRRWRRA